MSFILHLLILVSSAFAVQSDQFYLKAHDRLETVVAPISQKIDQLASRTEDSDYQLQRFDLDLSLSAEAGVLVFSKGIEKGIELIWERKENDSQDEAREENLLLGHSAEETAQSMLPPIIQVLSELKATNEVRERVIRRVYKDASKLTKYVRALQSFNGQESWYVANYFKNYYFSASGDILSAGVGYDKRLRFRFRTPTPLLLPEVSKRYERRIHRRLRKVAKHLGDVQALDQFENRFTMNRVRSVEGLEGGINFGFGEVAMGKGILLEWLPASQSGFVPVGSGQLAPVVLRNLATLIETTVPDTTNFALSQIRIKGSIEKELSVFFLNVQKFKEIEYHYRLKK